MLSQGYNAGICDAMLAGHSATAACQGAELLLTWGF